MTRQAHEKAIWTWDGIAAALGVARNTAKNWANPGKLSNPLPVGKVGGRVFITRRKLDEWLNYHQPDTEAAIKKRA